MSTAVENETWSEDMVITSDEESETTKPTSKIWTHVAVGVGASLLGVGATLLFNKWQSKKKRERILDEISNQLTKIECANQGETQIPNDDGSVIDISNCTTENLRELMYVMERDLKLNDLTADERGRLLVIFERFSKIAKRTKLNFMNAK